MSITSFAFAGFAALLAVVYRVLPQRVRWWALLAASVIFYAAGGPAAAAYMAVTAVTTYFAALLLQRENDRRAAMDGEQRRSSKRSHDRRRHLVTGAACAVNFGMLFAIKYWDFVSESLAFLRLPALGLVVPMGISFYIFQSIGYVADVSRGKTAAERSFPRYLLFVCFFPQMVQGPIDRFEHLAPQLFAGRRPDTDEVRDGIQLMMWGYFKKLVIASRAGTVVGAVYANAGAYPGCASVFAVLMYTIELYCDFSGGIDIVRGTAGLFGINMAENFRRPIFSLSLAEFWRRWHMTLGGWMRDYVFYPLSLSKPFAALGRFSRKHLSGKLGRILPTSLATFIVYFIIGIWHGANLTFLAYGLYNGAIITSSILLAPFYTRVKKALKVNESGGLYRAFCIVRTSLVVFVGRYLTRAPWLKMSLVMLKRSVFDLRLRELPGVVTGLGMSFFDLALVAAGCAVVLAAEYIEERGVGIRAYLAKRGAFVQWLAIAVPLAVILIFGVISAGSGAGEFIYGRI